MTEQEELIRLRTLLAAKDKVIADQEKLIQKQQIQIDNMIQALLHARKKLFGSSSEKTQMDGQLSLFESVQELADELLEEQKKITVKSHEKTPRKSGVRARQTHE